MLDFLQDVLDALLPILILILVPVAVGALVRLFNKMGLDVEAHHREALQTALQNAALVAVSKRRGSTALSGPVKMGVPIGPAIDYVQKSVPDALVQFGISRGRLGELLEPHISTALAVVPQENTDD